MANSEIEQEQVLALDVGYGHTKFKTHDMEFKIPTAVAKLKESFAEFGTPEGYLFNNKRYLVGDKAVSNAFNTRGFKFLTDYVALIAFKAIEMAGFDINKPITIKTGLSLFNWNNKEEFIEALRVINVNNIVIKPKIKLMAQGEGIYHEYTGKKDGLVCVSDMGYKTLDFLVFDDGVPQISLSFANSKGANLMITDLKARLQKQYGFNISELAVNKAFNDGFISNFGEEIDLSDVIAESKEDYATIIIDELHSNIGDLLQSANKIIFSGGGAYFMDSSKFKKNMTFSTSPYEFSNVRGYFKS